MRYDSEAKLRENEVGQVEDVNEDTRGLVRNQASISLAEYSRTTKGNIKG
jgi:hypothetical protein